MKNLLLTIFITLLMFSCKNEKTENESEFISRNFKEVEIVELFKDSTLNIRAIEVDQEGILYGSSISFGVRDLSSSLKIDISKLKAHMHKDNLKAVIKFEEDTLAFRSIAIAGRNMFALSVGKPGRLYKTEIKKIKPELVYEEVNEKVFYDAMDFWNDLEGIAIGDPTDDCMSVIITRDGGNTWSKLSCDSLPKAKDGEAAFAASDTNIAIVGDKTWVATGGKASRILFSPDKGKTWEVFDTPIIQGLETTGMYSLDFYDELNGFAIGGDYTKPDDNTANKIRTKDGGKTWHLVAENQNPGYRSCVQYIPGCNAKELVAIGFKGIDYSKDSGETWKHLSDEGFYTIRFVNDSVAYAAGSKRISKLTFK